MNLKNSYSICFDILLIPAPSLGSLDSIIPFLVCKFANLEELDIAIYIYDFKLFGQLQSSNNFIHLLKKYNISIILNLRKEFLFLPVLNFDKFFKKYYYFKSSFLFQIFIQKNIKLFRNFSTIKSLNSIADFKIVLSRFPNILDKIKISNYLSIRHGINLFPLLIKIPQKINSDIPNFPKSITYHYNSKEEYSYVSNYEHIIQTEYKYVPISRHQEKWLNSSKIYHNKLHNKNYIAIFTRPLSDYILYSDLKLYKNIFLKISKNYPDISFFIKPHPKEKNIFFKNFLESISISNKVYVIRNLAPLDLASNALFSITLYSGLSIDFSFHKIPHLELYFPSLSRFCGFKGFFIDHNNLPSLDFRGFGLTSALTSYEQVEYFIQQNKSFKNDLIEFHNKNYSKRFKINN